MRREEIEKKKKEDAEKKREDQIRKKEEADKKKSEEKKTGEDLDDPISRSLKERMAAGSLNEVVKPKATERRPQTAVVKKQEPA